MGLDQFAYKTKTEADSLVSRTDAQRQDSELLHQWRKHPDLHGWMTDLFFDRDGEGALECFGGFNSDTVDLTIANLEDLEQAIADRDLPSTEGFFFGESYEDEDDRTWRNADDATFIKNAREAIQQGYHVYYTSSW